MHLCGNRVLVFEDQVAKRPEQGRKVAVHLPDRRHSLRRTGQLLLLAPVPLAQQIHQMARVGLESHGEGTDLIRKSIHGIQMLVRNIDPPPGSGLTGGRLPVEHLTRHPALHHGLHQPRQRQGEIVELLEALLVALLLACGCHPVDQELRLLHGQHHLLPDEKVRPFVVQRALQVARDDLKGHVDGNHRAKPRRKKYDDGARRFGDIGNCCSRAHGGSACRRQTNITRGRKAEPCLELRQHVKRGCHREH